MQRSSIKMNLEIISRKDFKRLLKIELDNSNQMSIKLKQNLKK